MPIESVTYISDLNAANPVGSTDKVQTLDDHIRNVKLALLNTFPNITGAVTLTQAQINAVSDAALLSAGNVFTSNQLINRAGSALWTVRDTSAATNEKRTSLGHIGGDFYIFSADDADGFGASLLVATRTGTAWDSLAFTATAITLNGVAASDFARLSAANAYTSTASYTSAGDANHSTIGVSTMAAFLGGNSGAFRIGTSSNTAVHFYQNNTIRGDINTAGNWTLNGVSQTDFA